MTCFAPISGTFPHFAARWVDPAFGFAVGWNYFYTQAITVPVEVTAAQILLTFWDDNHNRGIGYTAIILVFMCAINLFGVRWFGESEFVFSILKRESLSSLLSLGSSITPCDLMLFWELNELTSTRFIRSYSHHGTHPLRSYHRPWRRTRP